MSRLPTGCGTYQVAAPGWLAEALFEIVAKAPEGSNRQQFPEMMRRLLAERFKLEAHKETRELSGFALVVGKDGPKMMRSRPQQAPRGPAGGYTSTGTFRVQGGGNKELKNITMEMLARELASLTGRPVTDETGIFGRYDIALEYTGFDTAAGGRPLAADPEPGVSLFTSIQKLGLKLEPRKVPGEVVIVDRIEKTPTENQPVFRRLLHA